MSPRNDLRHFGSIDTKIVDFNMIKNSEIMAISGPSHFKKEPFEWKTENEVNHFGIPKKMNFDWVKFKPKGLDI